MDKRKVSRKTEKPPYRLLANNRFWLLCTSGLLAMLVALAIWAFVPPGDLRLIRVQQTYGLLGIVFLYLALMATPLTKLFPNIKFKNEYLHLRRAIGVSAFFFSLLHTLIAFFGQLEGFNGLAFLSERYTVALLLGVAGLIVLTAMAVTSFDTVIEKMGFPRWKRLHRLIYIAGLAILVHVVMLGSHFFYGSSIIAWITFAAVAVLLLMEAIRIDRHLRIRYYRLQNYGVASTMLIGLFCLGAGFILAEKINIDPGKFQAHGSHNTVAVSDKTLPPALIFFENSPSLEGSIIQPDKSQISFQRLMAGGETINFVTIPAITGATSAECFMVNQRTHLYYQGHTQTVNGKIQCRPATSNNPPAIGSYTLYLKLERPGKIDTVPFNLEIQP